MCMLHIWLSINDIFGCVKLVCSLPPFLVPFHLNTPATIKLFWYHTKITYSEKVIDVHREMSSILGICLSLVPSSHSALDSLSPFSGHDDMKVIKWFAYTSLQRILCRIHLTQLIWIKTIFVMSFHCQQFCQWYEVQIYTLAHIFTRCTENPLEIQDVDWHIYVLLCYYILRSQTIPTEHDILISLSQYL